MAVAVAVAVVVVVAAVVVVVVVAACRCRCACRRFVVVARQSMSCFKLQSSGRAERGDLTAPNLDQVISRPECGRPAGQLVPQLQSQMCRSRF